MTESDADRTKRLVLQGIGLLTAFQEGGQNRELLAEHLQALVREAQSGEEVLETLMEVIVALVNLNSVLLTWNALATSEPPAVILQRLGLAFSHDQESE